MTTNYRTANHQDMNNFFIILGTGCQLILAIYFVAKLFSRKATGRLRLQYSLSALLFGGFGSMLIYSWLQFSQPQQPNLSNATLSARQAKSASDQSKKMVSNKAKSDLYAYIK